MLVLRAEAVRYFAALRFGESRLRHRVVERTDVKWVVLGLSGVNDIDASAVQGLEELSGSHRERGVAFVFAGMKGPVDDIIQRSGWEAKVGHWRGGHSTQQTVAKPGLRLP